MHGSNFAVESGNLDYREIKEKGGFVRIGFDAKMFALNSKKDVEKFLDSSLEDWKMRNPKHSPTEIRYEICSRADLIVGGRSYTGFMYFKPVPVG
jgi:hypothetical protein